jgi:hypothetical protein
MNELNASGTPGKQLEALAWSIVASTTAGNDVSVRQLNAAREIIKEASHAKTPPPPVKRKLRFVINTIDYCDTCGNYKTVARNIYEVKT